jgi:hypothetical protein
VAPAASSATRNTGLRHSEDEYVGFPNAGDRLLPEALEAGVKLLSAHPGCAFVSGRIIAANGSFLRRSRRRVIDKDGYIALLQRNYMASSLHSLYPVRRE